MSKRIVSMFQNGKAGLNQWFLSRLLGRLVGRLSALRSPCQWSARVTSSGRRNSRPADVACRGNGRRGHHFLDCKPGGCFCQVLHVKSPQNPGANPRKNRGERKGERNAGIPSQKIGKFPLLRFGICGIIGSFGGVLSGTLSGTEGLCGSPKTRRDLGTPENTKGLESFPKNAERKEDGKEPKKPKRPDFVPLDRNWKETVTQ